MKNIGFLGAGNMGYAIMKGISQSELKDVKLFAYDLSEESLKRAESVGATVCSSENELVEKSDFVFLAVKPQVLSPVLEKIKSSLTPDKVVISIAAGITGEYLKKRTNENLKAILVMPNTPLLLGEGATALSKVSPTTDDEFSLVCDIFNACGKTSVLSEDKMKEIIAVNGSSPAFIYLFAKGFIDYAQSEGIDPLVAKELFAQTLIGSAKMITDSGNTIEELIKMVSSPGGTTLAGLDRLYEGDLTGVVKNACESCTKRAYELSE
ncbi:MAG: pyrroline-5-carboxylate reductase [Oscillospiraceae bacterium]|nr:pyrroline-5-carboxylate reductase [Oscillospiraceae bacterium]